MRTSIVVSKIICFVIYVSIDFYLQYVVTKISRIFSINLIFKDQRKNHFCKYKLFLHFICIKEHWLYYSIRYYLCCEIFQQIPIDYFFHSKCYENLLLKNMDSSLFVYVKKLSNTKTRITKISFVTFCHTCFIWLSGKNSIIVN